MVDDTLKGNRVKSIAFQTMKYYSNIRKKEAGLYILILKAFPRCIVK